MNDVVLIEVLCAPYCELANIEINFSEQDGSFGDNAFSAGNSIFQKEGANVFRFKNVDLPESWQPLSNKRAVVRFVPTQAAHSLDSVVAGAGGSLTCNILKPGGGAIKWAEKGAEVFASPRANDGYSLVGLYLLPKDAPLPTGDFSIASDFTPLGNNYQFTMPDYDAKVVAVFRSPQTGTVAVSTRPAEGGTATGGGQYQLGSLVTVKATPAEGYKFVRWSEITGNNVEVTPSNQAEYAFGLTANKSLTAVFELRKYTVTVSASPAEGGTVTGGGAYAPGQSATVTAAANEGYEFAGWYDGTSKVSDEASYTFTPTGDITLTARFKIKTKLTASVMHDFVYDQNDNIVISYALTRYTGGFVRPTESQKLQLTCNGKKVDAIIIESAIDIKASDLGPGRHTVTVSYPGSDEYTAASASVTITVVKKLALSLVDFAPAYAPVNAPYTVSGRIIDENGDPYGGKMVVFAIQAYEGSLSNYPLGGATTDADGRFSLQITTRLPDAPSLRRMEIRCAETETHLYCRELRKVRFTDGTIYTVTFMDGDSELFKQSVESGQKVTPPTDPKKDGQVFDGWCTDQTLQTLFDFTQPITANEIVYARFAKGHNLYATVDPAEGGTVTGGGAYAPGQSVTVTATANEGYEFAGWYEGAEKVSDEASYTFTPTGDITLTARFKIKTELRARVMHDSVYNQNASIVIDYKLTRYTGGSLPMNEGEKIQLTCNGKEVDATIDPGVRIYIAASELGLGSHTLTLSYPGSDVYTAASASVTVTVVRKLALSLVDFAPAYAPVNAPFTVSGRIIDENGDPYGGKTLNIMIQAHETPGYNGNAGSVTTDADGRFSLQITKYLPDATSIRRIIIMCNETETHLPVGEYREVRFTDGTIYTVTFMDGDSELFKQSVESGQKVTPPSDPKKDGQVFEGWCADQALRTAFDFTQPITANEIVYAKFAKEYNLYATVDPAEGGTVAFSKAKAKAGEEVTVKLTLNKGYTVKGISCPADMIPLNFIVDEWKIVMPEQDVTVEVTLNEPPTTYAVTVLASPAEGGTVSGDGKVTAGQSATVTATANEGYEFAGWYEGDECVSWEGAYTIASVTGDMTLTAKFTKMWTATIDMNGGEIFDGEGWKSSVSMDFEDGFKHEIPTADDMETFIDEGTWIKAPANSRYIGAEIDGVTYQPGQTYELKKNTTIKVLWASDQPQPAYTVTYVVENGTWADGTTAPKTEEVEDGQSPSQIPAGMIASEGFEGGAWDTDPNGAAITGNTIFTYTFTQAQPPQPQPAYTVTYIVVNGTWADGTTAPKTEEVEDGQSPSQVPTGMIASEGFEGGAWDSDPAGAAITGDTTFTYTFKQAQPPQPPTPPTAYTVTYMVENGTWADGATAPKTEEVEDGQSPSQIPTGMIASEGFEGGAWDTDPNGAAITGDMTFTYIFLAAANKTYVFTKGDSAFWTKGSAAALDFTVTGMPDDSKTFAAFTGIEVDGASVAAENYTAAAGSVNISLKSAYLEGLAAGEHTITARFADGSAQAKFIIKDKETPEPVYDFKFTFTKIWQGGHEDSIDWVLYYPNGTVARKKFNKKIVSESEWRYEAWFASGADYYIIEKPVDGYTVRYENVGAYADVTDRCYNGGTIINYKVPKTGDTANPRLWAGMMLLGVGAVCGTLVFGRRKKENR